MQALQSRLANSSSQAPPDRPATIALVITDLDPGGAEKALVALATRLDRSRWRPSVVCLGPEAKLVEPLRTAGIRVECLDVDRRRPIRAIARLARCLREIRPQLVQSFLFHANIAARLAAPWAGRPWVVGGIRVAEREKHWHLRLDRLTQRLSAGSVCVSRGVHRFSMDVARLDPRRLAVIPNGVELGPAARVGHTRVALFVGRIARQKGVATLLDAWEAIAHDRAGWTLKLAGDGPERAEWQRRPVAGVEWLGRRDDVPDLMNAADLLVLPSLWEGMPNAILEAMAAGLPIVATRVEGSEDLVRDEGPERNGWLAKPGDAASLAQALREAIAQPSRLEGYGRNGRARVEEEFSMDRVVNSYERLWSGLLGPGSKVSELRSEVGRS